MVLKTVDVAIGVVFLYLLITFTASAILELIATALNWRAKMLHDAIASMLGRKPLITVQEVYESPLIKALGRDNRTLGWMDVLERIGWRPPNSRIAPSYIPAATFSAVMLEGLMTKPAKAEELGPEGLIKAISGRVAEQQETNALLSVLRTTLATQGPSVQALRLAIEKWFNDSMDRASGWYKRRTQTLLLVLGLLIAFLGNVDTVAVVRWLWQGDAARQAVLAAAQEYARVNPVPKAAPAAPHDALQDFAKKAAQLDDYAASLQYPIGWWAKGRSNPLSPQYLCGALITAIAISMGSTFWFDALQSLLKIRGTGPRPGSR